MQINTEALNSNAVSGINLKAFGFCDDVVIELESYHTNKIIIVSCSRNFT